MGAKFNLEGFWNDWGAKLVSWLLTHGVKVLIVIVTAYILNFLLSKFISKIIKVSVTIDRHQSKVAEQKREETLIKIISWCLRIFLVLVVILIILKEVGLSVGPMLAGAGILGLAVGFGVA